MLYMSSFNSVTLAELRANYNDYMLEFSCVINGIVQISGMNNSDDTLLSVQYDSTDIHNRGVYVRHKPKFYLIGEDEYEHIRYVQDIPKPLKVYIANTKTKNKPQLIYSCND